MLNVIATGVNSSVANPVLDIWTQRTITDADGFVYYGLGAPFSIGWQIWDMRNQDAPVQVFPGDPGTKAPVDLVAHRIGGVDGHYAVVWTNTVTATTRGRYQVRWYVTDVNGGPEAVFLRDFDVLPAAASVVNAGTAYALVSDLRDEGIAQGDASDARLLRLLGMQARYIERITGRSFRPMFKTAIFDGSGGRAVMFGEPLIALVGLSLGQPPEFDIDRETFRVYNRHLSTGQIDPDDRLDPKIEFAHFADTLGSRRGSSVSSSLFGVPWRDHYFPQAVQNVTVRGLWGFTDYDGSATGMTPDLIWQAQKMLVAREVGTMGGCGASDREDAQSRHRITSETTRDQSYTKKEDIETPFTGDRAIDDILLLYRRPIQIGAVLAMRVRLINPFTVEIARFDSVQTESTDGGKPGYHPTFNEPDVKTVDGVRVSARAEKQIIRFPAQIEDRAWEALRQFDNGNSPDIGVGLIAHFHDLRHRGLVDCETGKVSLNVNDRLVKILDKCGRAVSVVRTPPGLYCVEVRPISYGIGGTLNLLMLLFNARNRGAKAG